MFFITPEPFLLNIHRVLYEYFKIKKTKRAFALKFAAIVTYLNITIAAEL